MITRTLTIAGSPNITHTLYFDSKSNAEKLVKMNEEEKVLMLSDDYGQVLKMHPDAVIISDVMQNGAEMLRAQAEIKIIEIKAQGKMQKRFNEDAELKAMRAEMARSAPPANA